jgi:tellurite resistance protein TerC
VNVSRWAWVVFGTLLLLALAIDVEFLRGKRGGQRRLTLRAAAIRNGAWVALAFLFGLGVLALYGQSAALTYLTAYPLEQSLSIDNVFVFVLIFSELRIPPAQQRSVLLWGVLGALVMRALLIGAGLLLLNRFHWVVYPFAALIISQPFACCVASRKSKTWWSPHAQSATHGWRDSYPSPHNITATAS